MFLKINNTIIQYEYTYPSVYIQTLPRVIIFLKIYSIVLLKRKGCSCSVLASHGNLEETQSIKV